MPNGQFPPVFNLADLNGLNGFKLDGEATHDYSGYSVSSAGDINGDGHVDLLIGAYGHNSQTGRSYVLFGGPGVGSGGVIALSSFTGSTGFKLDGEATVDESGYSVSSAGDINGDGVLDLLVGADGHNGYTGRSYVLFGGPGVGSGGMIALSSLTGSTGFKLDGEATFDYSGWSVSSAGDINGDGVSDLLIGAPYHSNYTGRSYVLFGDAPPVIIHNQLMIEQGQRLAISSNSLSAYDKNHANNTLVFISSNVVYGQFELISSLGIPLVNFTQQQIQDGMILFAHDGSEQAPSYDITVRSTGIAWTGPQAANITFVFPILIKNQLTLTNGETVIFSVAQLQAIEPTSNNSALQFYRGIVQQGRFSSTFTNQTITEFSQADIESGAVKFIHAGNKKTPGYFISVSDGVQITSPRAAAITFIGAPVITQNSVTIAQSGTITLTPADLNITVTDGSVPGQVTLQVTNLQDAVITSNVTGTPTPVSNFTLAQLESGNIQLTQDGSPIAPSYTITVTSDNSGLSSAPSPVDSHLHQNTIFAPKLLSNYLYVTQGQSTLLTPQNLHATQDNGTALDGSAIFYVSNVAHGQFTLIDQPDILIPFFSKAQLQNSSVQFTPDGTRNIPAYSAAVSAFGLQSANMPAQIFFRTVNQPPTLAHPLVDQSVIAGQPFTYEIPPDTFTDPQGYALTLSASRFNSTQPLPDWLNFSETNNRFSGTPPLPEVDDIGVTARNSAGLSAETDFVITVLPKFATSNNNTLDKAIVSAAVTGAIGLLFLLLKVCLKRASNKKLLDALGEGSDDFDLNVVRPVAKEIARRVKITGFLSYTTNTEMAHFKGAVRTILTELQARNVETHLDTMDAAHRDGLINEIATQTQLRFTSKQPCCSAANCMSFFKPQATAEDIRQAAPAIATSVASATEERGSVKSISMRLLSQKPRSEDLDSSERGISARS